MKETTEVNYCKKLLEDMGRYEKLKLIRNSSLNNRERKIITLRFIEGMSVTEASSVFNLDESSFKKAQKKAFIKLYNWHIKTTRLVY